MYICMQCCRALEFSIKSSQGWHGRPRGILSLEADVQSSCLLAATALTTPTTRHPHTVYKYWPLCLHSFLPLSVYSIFIFLCFKPFMLTILYVCLCLSFTYPLSLHWHQPSRNKISTNLKVFPLCLLSIILGFQISKTTDLLTVCDPAVAVQWGFIFPVLEFMLFPAPIHLSTTCYPSQAPL